MMTNPVGGLDSRNAAYNWMNASTLLVNFCSFKGNSKTLLSSEQNLTLSMLNDNLTYKAGLLQEESMKNVRDKNIKRTFSTFA